MKTVRTKSISLKQKPKKEIREEQMCSIGKET